MILQPAAFDLKALINGTIRLLRQQAKSKGIALAAEIGSDVPAYMVGDSTRLRQVLLNLLSNAVKFTSAGSVTCRVSSESRSGETATLRFEVIDTGIGIAQDRIAAIFDSFTQADGSIARRFGGTGLGLAISSGIVRLLGGEIQVESSPGAGSTFHFTIALPVASTASMPADGSFDAALFPPMSVLVAEDNSVNRTLITRILSKLSCRVTSACDGEEACHLFEQQSFDLVLMDMQMPGVDGLEATRRIRLYESVQRRPHTPVIALTANAVDSDREECLAAGMDGYVKKPIRLEELASEVHRCVVQPAQSSLAALTTSVLAHQPGTLAPR